MTKSFKKSDFLTDSQRLNNLEYLNATKMYRNLQSDENKKAVSEAFDKFQPIVAFVKTPDGDKLPKLMTLKDGDKTEHAMIGFSGAQFINLSKMPDLFEDNIIYDVMLPHNLKSLKINDEIIKSIVIDPNYMDIYLSTKSK